MLNFFRDIRKHRYLIFVIIKLKKLKKEKHHIFLSSESKWCKNFLTPIFAEIDSIKLHQSQRIKKIKCFVPSQHVSPKRITRCFDSICMNFEQEWHLLRLIPVRLYFFGMKTTLLIYLISEALNVWKYVCQRFRWVILITKHWLRVIKSKPPRFES